MPISFPQRILSQKNWPAAGDIDDCVVLADFMAIHCVAPWLWLPNVTQYRAAAGNPDDPTKGDGLTIGQSAAAFKALYPQLAITVIDGTAAWSTFAALVKANRPASLCVKSAAIATKNGVAVGHRVTVQVRGGKWYMGNPIKAPHAAWVEIAEFDAQGGVGGVRREGVRGRHAHRRGGVPDPPAVRQRDQGCGRQGTRRRGAGRSHRGGTRRGDQGRRRRRVRPPAGRRHRRPRAEAVRTNVPW